jgi:hypothetical protein
VPAPSVDRPQATQYRRNCSRPARLAAARASAGGSLSRSHLRGRAIGAAAVHSSVPIIGTVAAASSSAVVPAIGQCSPRVMQVGVASTRSAHAVPAIAFSDRPGKADPPGRIRKRLRSVAVLHDRDRTAWGASSSALTGTPATQGGHAASYQYSRAILHAFLASSLERSARKGAPPLRTVSRASRRAYTPT